MSIDRKSVVAEDGIADLELRFNGGFGGIVGSEAIRRALGRNWPEQWRIRSLDRDGDAAVLILRRVEIPTEAARRMA